MRPILVALVVIASREALFPPGHLDLIFNCTHDTYQMMPATIGMVTKGKELTSRDLAFEGSLKVALGDLNHDGFSDVVCCPNGIGVHHDRRFVSIAWGGPDGWSATAPCLAPTTVIDIRFHRDQVGVGKRPAPTAILSVSHQPKRG